MIGTVRNVHPNTPLMVILDMANEEQVPGADMVLNPTETTYNLPQKLEELVAQTPAANRKL